MNVPALAHADGRNGTSFRTLQTAPGLCLARPAGARRTTRRTRKDKSKQHTLVAAVAAFPAYQCHGGLLSARPLAICAAVSLS